MKRLLFVFTLIIFSVYSIQAQSASLRSPAYMGLVIIDAVNADKMTETCRYYQLSEQPSEEGFHVFTHKDGTKIRFKVDKTEKGILPEVQIISKEKSGAINKILTEAGFEKQGLSIIEALNSSIGARSASIPRVLLPSSPLLRSIKQTSSKLPHS